MGKRKSEKHPQGKEKDMFTPNKKQYTVMDAKKKLQNQAAETKERLQKLKAICEASRVDLEERYTRQIIERAVTRRPIKMKQKGKKKKEVSTAFTEEDFKKFEEEYKS